MTSTFSRSGTLLARSAALRGYDTGTRERRLRRVGPGSAFKVGALLYGLMFAILGLFFILLPALLGANMLGALGQNGGGGAAIVGLVLYVLGTLAYAVFGGIFSAIIAALYNLVAGMVGGLRVELSDE